MFIPRTQPVFENLSTSYVLIDLLVDDLCEGGFTGVVEVVLRKDDCLIVFGGGAVLAATEGRGAATDRYVEGPEPQPARNLGEKRRALASVAQIAARSRNERGRLSIYSCSLDAARSIADRLAARSLYTRLSTEFADLDRMIAKLARENEREWFLDVETRNGVAGLIHLKAETCSVFTSAHESASLQELLDKCEESGALFDVYYKVDSGPGQPVEGSAPAVALDMSPPESDAKAHELPFVAEDVSEPLFGPAEADPVRDNTVHSSIAPPVAAAESGLQPGTETAGWPSADRSQEQQVAQAPNVTAEAEAMAEIKRLMGEIASTIENAARSVESRDTFSMYLRAGQLKIADRFPFLDPFGNEFEYLDGEIVFVGGEKPEEFISGVSGAL